MPTAGLTDAWPVAKATLGGVFSRGRFAWGNQQFDNTLHCLKWGRPRTHLAELRLRIVWQHAAASNNSPCLGFLWLHWATRSRREAGSQISCIAPGDLVVGGAQTGRKIIVDHCSRWVRGYMKLMNCIYNHDPYFCLLDPFSPIFQSQQWPAVWTSRPYNRLANMRGDWVLVLKINLKIFVIKYHALYVWPNYTGSFNIQLSWLQHKNKGRESGEDWES